MLIILWLSDKKQRELHLASVCHRIGKKKGGGWKKRNNLFFHNYWLIAFHLVSVAWTWGFVSDKLIFAFVVAMSVCICFRFCSSNYGKEKKRTLCFARFCLIVNTTTKSGVFYCLTLADHLFWRWPVADSLHADQRSLWLCPQLKNKKPCQNIIRAGTSMTLLRCKKHAKKSI